MRIQAWSDGGGTQSTGIAALIYTGQLKPPDVAIIVDTEREASQTWEYHEKITKPKLLEVGVVVHRVSKSKYATVDLYGGKEKDTLLIPAFTNQSGKIGKLPTFCSNEWKERVVRRFCNELYPNAEGFDLWLGISRDEADRMRTGTGKWQYKHPLVDDKRWMNRQDCLKLVRSLGWPDPPRSRCYMCPNQGPREWQDLETNWPEDFAKAMAFEAEIQKRDPNVFLRDESGSQGDCMSGLCFV